MHIGWITPPKFDIDTEDDGSVEVLYLLSNMAILDIDAKFGRYTNLKTTIFSTYGSKSAEPHKYSTGISQFKINDLITPVYSNAFVSYNPII